MRPGTKPPFSVVSYDLEQGRKRYSEFGGGRAYGDAVGNISAEFLFDEGEEPFNTVQEAFDTQKEVTWGIWAGKNTVMYITGIIVEFKCVVGAKNTGIAASEITMHLTCSPCWETEEETQ